MERERESNPKVRARKVSATFCIRWSRLAIIDSFT